jgi:hypothetical protein
MTGSNLRGLTGSNLRGLTGSNLRGLTGSNLRGAAAVAFAVGPVESLDTTDDGFVTLTILGQHFKAEIDSAAAFSRGDYVAAATDADGDLLMLHSAGSEYRAGVSPVALRGNVTAVDSARAEVTVGGLTVDYAAYLTVDPSYAPKIGDIVDANGTQPLPHGSLQVGAFSDAALVSGHAIESIGVSQTSGENYEADRD